MRRTLQLPILLSATDSNLYAAQVPSAKSMNADGGCAPVQPTTFVAIPKCFSFGLRAKNASAVPSPKPAALRGGFFAGSLGSRFKMKPQPRRREQDDRVQAPSVLFSEIG